MPIAISSFVVKSALDVLGAEFVLAAELFEFEIDADESEYTIDEATGVYTVDMLETNGAVALVWVSKTFDYRRNTIYTTCETKITDTWN